MARIAEERLDAVRKYLHQDFPDWALAERWDGEHEAHTFLLKKHWMSALWLFHSEATILQRI